MIQRNEPDPTAGETDPEYARLWHAALESVADIFADYPANEETYRTIRVFLRAYMHEHAHPVRNITFIERPIRGLTSARSIEFVGLFGADDQELRGSVVL